MNKSDYFDPQTEVERVGVDEMSQHEAVAASSDSYPIVRYAQVLNALRKKSAAISGERQQMAFGQLVKDSLNQLSGELALPEGHFSVDTSGDPLLVREGLGQHWILPTHFEQGAYFSAPHADHHYELAGDRIPRIRIGRYARFGKGSGINAGGDITVGDGAWLSPGSLLLRQDHGAYGRPAIGARTVSMTSQPAIVLRDYAWVGRDAMVGWNSDYLGLAGIVGTRSFINSWVGDYSIVGDHDRVLQYQPFKAFLLGRFDLSVEEVLRISDWARVDQDWLKVYAARVAELLASENTEEFAEALSGALGPGGKALLVKPSSLRFLPALTEGRLDVVTNSQELTPFLLQWASDRKNRRTRVRSDLHGPSLPLETAGTFHYNKRIGYDAVVAEYDGLTPAIPLAELQRPLLQGGTLVVDVRNLADGGGHPDNLIETRDLRIDGQAFKVFEKK